MKEALLRLIESNETDYNILRETCSDIISGEPINYEKLDKLEEQCKNIPTKKYLTKEEDMYLGKIIYSYTVIQENFYESLYYFKNLNIAYDRSVNLLVSYNLALPMKIASSFKGLGVDREDLIQEGTIKLLIAAKKYDYRKGNKFVTYATYWVKQGMREAIHNQSKNIRKPSHIINTLNKINEAREKLKKELGTEPNDKEISLETEIPIEKINKYLQYSQDTVSFQANLEDGENTFENLLSSDNDIEEDVCNDMIKEAIKKAFKTLTEKEIQVLTLRFGLDNGNPRTLDEVGNIMGITRERVRQIESKALRGLRHPSRSKYLIDYA